MNQEQIEDVEREQRRKQLEDKVFLALISFFSGAIFGLVWAYMQAH